MGYRIPLSNKTGVTYDYKGVTTFGPCRWNSYMQCWVTDFNFEDEVIVQSFALRGGVNCLRQFNIPYSIYVVNKANNKLDPGNFSSLVALIFEEGDLQSVIDDNNPNPGGKTYD